jgi:TatD DNase family protein
VNLVDSHCHLADPKLHGDLDPILERAREAGLRMMIAVGAIGAIEIDRKTVAIAERHADIYAAVGVHPHDATDCDDERIVQLRDLARSPRVVAIGESGLDFHYMHSPAAAQEAAMRRQLELAAEVNRPIVIHCRDAEARLAAIVREVGMPPCGGVIHCFTGDAGAAREFLALGFYISFSGIVTFKSAATLREAVPIVPADRLLTETDSPYLAPEPYRGKRNEPAFIARTFATLAKLRSCEPDAMAAQVAANACRLFQIASA